MQGTPLLNKNIEETHTAHTPKNLDDLIYTPTWVSHMGRLSGCTRHLDPHATDSWPQPII